MTIIGTRTPFRDRHTAWDFLAQALEGETAGRLLVLGIPRGGVVIGSAVARELGAELDVVIARKLSAPGNEELAIGAVMEEGGTWLNRDLIAMMGVEEEYIEQEKAR